MEYITTKDASKKWGISTSRITLLANENRIPGAKKLGRSWFIPASATKPEALVANHSKTPRKALEKFSFPLYHFRPDFSSDKEAALSSQQKNLLQAESLVLECRFRDAYPMLDSILQAPDDIYTELGALWNAGICCMALNKPEEFSKKFLRLKFLLSGDFPHKDDCVFILENLKTYIETIAAASKKDIYNPDTHYQVLPLMCVQTSYGYLSKETMKPGMADTKLLEINLRFLENSGSIVAIELVHCHLLAIYFLRQDFKTALSHAEAIVRLAYENKCYFPFVSYYNYLKSVFTPILDKYPKDFIDHSLKLVSEYDENFTAFFSATNKSDIILKLSDSDYPFVLGVLMDVTYTKLAKNMGISPATVKRRLIKIYEKLGLKTKTELKEYLRNYV